MTEPEAVRNLDAGVVRTMDPEATWTIAKADFDRWLERLIEETEVIAPTEGPGGDELFSAVSSPDEILWKFENPLQPPKHFMLPQTERLVTIRRDNGRFQLDPVPDIAPRVLFNLRSCDVKGMSFLRTMHASDLPDSAYLRRADRTTLVSLTCSTPCPLGFCICCNAGPFLQEGYDLQLTDLGERMLVEVGSDKGEVLLGVSDSLFRPAASEEWEERLALEDEARRSFGKETCHLGSAVRRISTGRVAEELWDEMGDWCQECGGCNFACPTCYCFSVQDLSEDGGWTRCRIWDSCQYPAFTLEASGHNPRERKGARIRRRFFHKVSAQYYHRDGDVGCVGCGRCIKVCMGTTDMPAVVAAIRKGEWNG